MSEPINELDNRPTSKSLLQNEFVKRLVLFATIFLVGLLLGLVPMWMKLRECARVKDLAQAELRVKTLQASLANATIDARRGEYEPARQSASEFFTNLRTETDRTDDLVFNSSQRESFRPLFEARDEVITLLARSDPASLDRLADLYTKYRQATASATTNQK
jgi:hypothetical protein